MPIRALLFDFDGLILDTETPLVEVWKAIFAEHGFDYPQEHWSKTIGGWGLSNFDPAEELHRLSGGTVDAEALRRRGTDESDAVILRSPMMEGVQEILTAGRRLDLRLAVASSSERSWVEPHLVRLGLREYFEKVICGDDVPAGRTKPHPDVFLKALDMMEIKPEEAIVFEDAPHGIRAAHSAGLFVVAVPNPVTAQLSLEGADLVLSSLSAMPLEEIVKRSDGSERTQGLRRPLPGAQPLT